MPQRRYLAIRLKARMQEMGMSAVDVAKRTELKPSFLYDIMNGKSTNPSAVKLAKVAKELGVSLGYLLDQKPPPAPTTPNTPFGQDNFPQPGHKEDFVTVTSVMVTASMGGGAEVTEEEEGEPYYFRRNWVRDRLMAQPENLRIIHVRGDSMEPTLYNNDIVLVDTAKRHPSPPGIFVVFDGIGLVAKRLEFLANSTPPAVQMISDNPQYHAYTRTVEEVEIIGRVVWFGREL